MSWKSLVLPLLATATLFTVPAVRGYLMLSQPDKVLLYAEQGFTLNYTDIYLNLTDQSECSCRRACEVHVKCKNSAFDPVTNQCHLTANPTPYLVVKPGATFLRRIKPSLDGLYYIVNNREKVYYSDAVARCANISGFRLAQAEVRANVDAMISKFADVPNWNGYAFIGLIKHSNGSWQWQDGTSVNMSIFGSGEPEMKLSGTGGGLFTISSTLILEVTAVINPNGPRFGYLCQANFNYLDW